MSLTDFIEILKIVAKDYGSFILGAIGLAITAVVGGKEIHKLLLKRIRHLEDQLDEARADCKKIQSAADVQAVQLNLVQKERDTFIAKFTRVKLAFSGPADGNIWLHGALDRPDRYDECMSKSIPILLVANLKGGVGKSTIAANLVAYFEREHNERVLAIDLDYQGSLSSMLLPEPYNREPRSAQTLKDLIEGRGNAHAAISTSRPIRDSRRDSRIIDADGPFANFETRLQIQWISGEVGNDIRYNLARMLLQPAVQTSFDRVIIDAPPRLTTGFINALCASTHLIVPFVLDTLSAERVGLFLAQIQGMRPRLFPHLQLAGVVGTMKRTDTDQIGDTEQLAFNEAKAGVMKFCGSSEYVFTGAPVPRKQSIADAAGLRIAYNKASDAAAIFRRLGALINQRAPGRYNADIVTPQAAE